MCTCGLRKDDLNINDAHNSASVVSYLIIKHNIIKNKSISIQYYSMLNHIIFNKKIFCCFKVDVMLLMKQK